MILKPTSSLLQNFLQSSKSFNACINSVLLLTEVLLASTYNCLYVFKSFLYVTVFSRFNNVKYAFDLSLFFKTLYLLLIYAIIIIIINYISLFIIIKNLI